MSRAWALLPRFLGEASLRIPEPLPHQLVAFGCAVVPDVEPRVDRHRAVGVAHLEILVVHVVGVDACFLPRLDLVEADMPDQRARAGGVQVVLKQERVRGQSRVSLDAGE